ncbi:MAG TPA: signal peptide peptidase SppA [Thermoanaerobaculia bacterium]|nr:signal peptide peptidase SppA [Thermoanaerobaculia bacterium]
MNPETTSQDSAAQPRRSRKGCFILAALAALAVALAVGLLFVLGALFSMIGAMAGGGAAQVAGDSVLEIELTGSLRDAPPAVELGPLFGGGAAVPSLWDLRRALVAAAEDSRIRGARVWIHNSFAGWAGAEEIVTQLDRFRESGKPLHVLLQADLIDDVDYFLATSGDRVWATPQAASMVNGLAAEAMFLRGALDKLEIEADVIMYEEYKSAGEQFASYQMSPPMREALTAVLEDISGRFEQRVTTRRGVDAGALDALMARGVTPARALVDAGLVDELGFVDQVNEALREAAGLDEYRGVRLSRYLDALGHERRGGRRVAVVFGEGTIIAEPLEGAFPFFGAGILSGPVVARHLREAVDDERVAAILFRVNSPGGSPVGSDLVLREVERAREAGKPVIVSMGDVAGSGGYWVAMAADAIVAQPTTITGSIGVVFTHFNLDGFWDWLGVEVERIETAPNSDLLGFGPWEEGDRERVMAWMDETYESFTRGVAEGRDLDHARVLEIARGRIWSGADALELELVDELGGLDAAIRRVRESAGFGADEDVPLVVYPRAKTFFQQLMELSGGTARAASGQPGREALVRAVRSLARPRVQALMPEVRIR